MKQTTKNQQLRTKLILALDLDSFDKARHFVDRLSPKIKIFKVGLQLFTSCGPKIIGYIRRKGRGVFLDLKLFDIPNTVAGAVRQAARLRVKMLTLHIAGGEEMLEAAVKAARQEASRLRIRRPLLIGVTVLTSQKVKSAEVLRLAKIGLNCGLDGVVSSAREAALLRRRIKNKFIIVTPGIRPVQSARDDQKRIATAAEAIASGSDFLVVGRPILEAKDPLKALGDLLAQVVHCS